MTMVTEGELIRQIFILRFKVGSCRADIVSLPNFDAQNIPTQAQPEMLTIVSSITFRGPFLHRETASSYRTSLLSGANIFRCILHT